LKTVIIPFGELGSLWYGRKIDAFSLTSQKSGGEAANSFPLARWLKTVIVPFGELGSLWYGGVRATHRSHFQKV